MTATPETRVLAQAHGTAVPNPRSKTKRDRHSNEPGANRLGGTLDEAARTMLKLKIIHPGLAHLLDERLAEGSCAHALSLCDSQTRPEGIAVLGNVLDGDGLRDVLAMWPCCDGGSRGSTGKAILRLFRKAGYVTDTPGHVFTEPTVVYRGNLGEDPRLGFSWTLDREQAAWFSTSPLGPCGRYLGLDRADSGKPKPTVWKATVEPEAILAYFTDREEDEVIVDPDKLTEFEIDHRPECWTTRLQLTRRWR